MYAVYMLLMYRVLIVNFELFVLVFQVSHNNESTMITFYCSTNYSNEAS